MERRDEREFREELVSLRAQHRQLDCEIMALEADPSADQLLVKRLKKKKLVLKDRITQIEDKLLPDRLIGLRLWPARPFAGLAR